MIITVNKIQHFLIDTRLRFFPADSQDNYDRH